MPTPVASTAGNAAFEVTPGAEGSHYAAAATVDRADTAGAVHTYGFLRPQSRRGG
ncbi:hypothetical protein [Streptomyces sp. S4.7]|uniref:hypothetical protein n=1 Tax=Streptomyces sp. S4.7 TaxID=2705439 RepID=UPI0013DA3817|nr:hypothetical protein [Streptomyces sp. S4.7]